MAEYIIEAKDKRAGMDFEELRAAMKRAEDLGLIGRPKMRLGFKGQIQQARFMERLRADG
jgi:hypothetical protein